MMPKILKTIPFTSEKYREMQQKVSKLEQEREQVMERLIEARAMGDLSENGAYKYAKFELGNINRELKRYKNLLAKGFPAPKHTGAKDTVDFGSLVMVEKLDGSKNQREFTIVSGHESDPSKGKLSYSSPIGKALMRRKTGDKVIVDTPAGEVRYMIINVS
jgi:transcription elongation factor GreA